MSRRRRKSRCCIRLSSTRNYPVVKDLPGFERFPALGAPLERSIPGGGRRHTMTGSRFTAVNVLPRLTTRGSTPSATPMSTSTTWSSP